MIPDFAAGRAGEAGAVPRFSSGQFLQGQGELFSFIRGRFTRVDLT
jgi:hypothetical protein